MPKTFDPATEIPDLGGKTIFVTGGNTGLGASTVAALAAHNPAHIYLTARRRSAAETAVAEIKKVSPNANLTIIDMDLASLDSVKAAAGDFNASATRLDLLILNAGIAGIKPSLTKEGYEIHMGTNHMGHALLMQMLMPVLLKTAAEPGSDVRIIVLASEAHRLFGFKEGIQFDNLKKDMAGTSGMKLYGQSKLANMLFARSMAQRYPQIKTVHVHPGVVNTSILTKMNGVNPFLKMLITPIVTTFAMSPDEGAKNQLWASVAKDVTSGTYYEPIGKLDRDSKVSKDQTLIDRMWGWTDEELKTHGGPGWADAKS